MLRSIAEYSYVWPRYMPVKLTPSAGLEVPAEAGAAAGGDGGGALKSPGSGSKFYTIERRMRSPTGGTLLVTVVEARNLMTLHRRGRARGRRASVRRGPAAPAVRGASPAAESGGDDEEDAIAPAEPLSRELSMESEEGGPDGSAAGEHTHRRSSFAPVVSLTSSAGTVRTGPGELVEGSKSEATGDVFHWHNEYGEEGETIEVDARSGEAFSVELLVTCSRGAPRVGTALLQVEWLSNGDTLLYGTDADDVPVVRRVSLRRASGAGTCDMWIPLEAPGRPAERQGPSCRGNRGAAVRLRLEMDWNYARTTANSLRIDTGLGEESTANTAMERKAMVIQRAIRRYLDAAADRRSAALAARQGMAERGVICVSAVEVSQTVPPRRFRVGVGSRYVLRATYAGRELLSGRAAVAEGGGLRRLTFPDTILEWPDEDGGGADTIEVELCKSSPVSGALVPVGSVAVDVDEIEENVCRHIVRGIETARGRHLDLQLRVTRLVEWRAAGDL